MTRAPAAATAPATAVAVATGARSRSNNHGKQAKGFTKCETETCELYFIMIGRKEKRNDRDLCTRRRERE